MNGHSSEFREHLCRHRAWVRLSAEIEGEDDQTIKRRFQELLEDERSNMEAAQDAARAEERER